MSRQKQSDGSEPPASSSPASGSDLVYVVDDDDAMRSSLCWLIESVGLPVRPCSSAEEFLAAYDPKRPACLVLDVRMPRMSGLDLQQEMEARRISLPIIMITAFGEVSTAVRAMKGGAFDFIEKPFGDQVLLDQVRAAIAADTARRRVDAEHAVAAARLARLTRRQRQVLERVVQGLSNKAIATELGLSDKTVEAHRAQVMKKLGAASVVDLVRTALSGAGAERQRGS
jgi:FixJ family two-component response regulator